jgi:hypothetical protein
VRRFLFVLLVGLACGRRAPQTDFVLRVAVVGPLAPLEPNVDSTFTTAAQDIVYDQFLTPDEQGVLTSRVLQRWELIDDQHYRIQLKPNLRFSDGSLARTQDAIASLGARGLRASVRGEWLEIEPQSSGVPVESMLIFAAAYKQTSAGYVGTGPFHLVEQTEARIVLERNRPKPRRVNRVEIVAFPTSRDTFSRVVRGDANATLGLDERQLELIEGIPTLKPIRHLAHNAVTIAFNPRRFGTAARRRLAASLPIHDIARAFSESCRVGAGVPVQRPEIPPGRSLEILLVRYNASLDRVALALRRALGSRGGEIARMDASDVLARWKAGAFDIAIVPHAVWPDPVLAFNWQSNAPWNWTRYSNPQVDAAFARGDFAAAKAELEADPPVIELCRRERIGVVDARIKNPRMGWWGILDTLPDWEVDE